MTQPKICAEFEKHLETVRKARQQTNKALKSLDPTRRRAGKTLAIAWEITYDEACRLRKEPKLQDLSTFAGVVFKLVQCQHQMLAGDQKTREMQATDNPAEITAGLTPEMRTELEEKLQLMS